MNIISYLNAIKFLFCKYPTYVILFVTGRCNCRCNHCFYWQSIMNSQKSSELRLDEIKKISENFRHIKYLSITGGEPSMRDDLPEIVNLFRKNNGVENVVLHTNGLLSEKIKDIVVTIVKENPGLVLDVSVSIDGLNKDHDSIRGVECAFERAKKTIEIIAEQKKNFKNLNVAINTCFTYFNQDKIKNTIDYFITNFNIDGYYIAFVRGNTMDAKAKEVDINKYIDVIRYRERKEIIIRYYDNYPLASFRRTLDFLCPEIVIDTVRKKRMIYPCKAGKTTVVISENGDVLPCEMLDKEYGNLRDNDYDIQKLLSSEKAKIIRSFIKTTGCYCTWECAIMNNLVFNCVAYPRLLNKWLKLELKKHFRK